MKIDLIRIRWEYKSEVQLSEDGLRWAGCCDCGLCKRQRIYCVDKQPLAFQKELFCMKLAELVINSFNEFF
jgi:hypothetical protein